MTQGIIGGATSYEEQSIKDILSDINCWIDYTQGTYSLIDTGITNLKGCKFWDKVPFNFQITLLSTLTCQKTYLYDFNIIKKSINEDRITGKEVLLLKKIGEKSWEFNIEYGRTYKEEFRWKDYGNPNFEVVENLYAKGRDYFVTLQDASNASARLKDYISVLPSITNNNITQHVTGSENIISGINSGEINFTHNDLSNFGKESREASERIDMLKDIDPDIKEYIKNLLSEATDAIKTNNKKKQESCKSDFKGFLIGAGAKAFKVIGILSSFASIASFFGITL